MEYLKYKLDLNGLFGHFIHIISLLKNKVYSFIQYAYIICRYLVLEMNL